MNIFSKKHKYHDSRPKNKTQDFLSFHPFFTITSLTIQPWIPANLWGLQGVPQTDRYVWRLAKRGEQPEDLRLEVERYTTGQQPKQHHHHLPLLVLTERHTAVLILKKK